MGKLIWSELGRIMAIVAALCLIDGGFHAFFFAVPTIPSIGTTLRFIYRPVSLPGVAAFFGGIITLLIEKPVFKVHNAAKFLFYMVLAVVSFFQFSTVPGSSFILISSLMYFTALALDEEPIKKTKNVLPVSIKQ